MHPTFVNLLPIKVYIKRLHTARATKLNTPFVFSGSVSSLNFEALVLLTSLEAIAFLEEFH